ncbi:TPA: restriction endonuclease subunit S, partial [Klebsiella quasipneumoniae]|nr:restriction endonuclease subunit S [Klebsiella quasipneumoniae]
MSELSYLEKLLDGVGVEWLPLKNVAEVRSGWGFPNAYQGKSKGDYPFYKVSDMNIIGNETVMSTANNFISNEVADKLGIRLAPAGTIIFPKIGAAIATNKKRLLFMPSAYDNNVMGLVTNEKVISRYVFYWMQTINLSTLANDSGAVPSIRKSEIEALLFPIPCPHNPEKSLAVQSEIVRILDKFTILTAELTAKLTTELIARKKQYNYYRDQLLSFDEDGVEWKTLGE